MSGSHMRCKNIVCSGGASQVAPTPSIRKSSYGSIITIHMHKPCQVVWQMALVNRRNAEAMGVILMSKNAHSVKWIYPRFSNCAVT